MTERERTVAVLRAMNRAALELAEVAGFSWSMKHPIERVAWIHMKGLEGGVNDILDAYNNDGLPETEPIQPEELQVEEETC